MTSSLVGSEMCIRDSQLPNRLERRKQAQATQGAGGRRVWRVRRCDLESLSLIHIWTLPTICSV
eukprot:10093737-Prorocentrum_lima.AAC.1